MSSAQRGQTDDGQHGEACLRPTAAPPCRAPARTVHNLSNTTHSASNQAIMSVRLDLNRTQRAATGGGSACHCALEVM